MASMLSQICRFVTRYLIATKFDPNLTVDQLREGLNKTSRLTILPAKTKVENVIAGNVSAEWVAAKNISEDNVVLYLHGGGYNAGSPATHRELAAHISAACKANVILPDYRLAPEHPFPAALKDATSTYRWLIKKGFSNGNVAIAGDSAGGGLSIATTISLRDRWDQLPSSVVCISPWTDLEMSGDSIRIHAEIDPMLNLPSLQMLASNYIGKADPRSSLISPIYADLKGFPSLLIHVGTDEMLLDDSKRLADQAKQAGVNVSLNIYDQMWHAWHVFYRLMPEAKGAVQEIGSFIRVNFEK